MTEQNDKLACDDPYTSKDVYVEPKNTEVTVKSEIIDAPWTAEQIKALNEWQRDGRVHPFTCCNNRMDDAHQVHQQRYGGDFGQLVATENGWVCPVCDYKQSWALKMMIHPLPS